MNLSKNTTVRVRHKRLGNFIGIVSRNFDTDEEEFQKVKKCSMCGECKDLSSFRFLNK